MSSLKLKELTDLTCPSEDAKLVCADMNGELGMMSIEEGTKKLVEQKLKFIVRLNSMSFEEKKAHLLESPEDIDYIMNACDDLKAVARFKRL